MRTKVFFPILIVFLTVFSWFSFLKSTKENLRSYQDNLELAKEYDAKGFYVEAIQCYKKVLEIQPDNLESQKAIANDYYNLEQFDRFVSAAEAIVADENKDTETAVKLAEYYISDNKLVLAFETIASGLKKAPDDEGLTDLYDSIKGQYVLKNGSFDTITEFRGKYAIASQNGFYNVVDEEGAGVLSAEKYEGITDFIIEDGMFFSAGLGGNNQYYDANEYLRLSPETDYDYLGIFQDGYALISKDDAWGYLDQDFKEVQFGFEEATAFTDGLAAVKKDGKWAVINDGFVKITDYEFEDVIVDEYHVCSTGNHIWVKRNGKYILIDGKGKEISEGFDAAKPFLNDTGCSAVCIGGKWGLVNQDGKLALECNYEELGSSNIGFAPYADNGKWGYINETGEILIDPSFSGAKTFDENGYGAVKGETSWQIIQLCLFGQ